MKEVGDVGEPLVGRGGELLRGADVPFLGERVELAADLRLELLDQLGDVVEVPVEGAAGELCLGHDSVDGHVAERVFPEEPHGGIADLLAGLFTLDPSLRALLGATHLSEEKQTVIATRSLIEC